MHEQALRIEYVDYASSFEELLIEGSSVKIDQCNLKVLAKEMCKISGGKFPRFIIDEFYTMYHTKLHYGVEPAENGNVKSLDSKLNYRQQKSSIGSFEVASFRWVCPKIYSDDVKYDKCFPDFENKFKKTLQILHSNC